MRPPSESTYHAILIFINWVSMVFFSGFGIFILILGNDSIFVRIVNALCLFYLAFFIYHGTKLLMTIRSESKNTEVTN